VYGLAALRVGYAIASPQVADALDRVRPIFNVNQPAQEAALASLQEHGAVGLRVEHARGARVLLHRVMAEAGLAPVQTQANFVYADVPGGDGEGLARAMLEQEGVIVRALTAFGSPGAIRVTAGADEENRIFASALGSVLASER
jgi:histidinol-phosphate aminotransferase